jgi:Ser/Thr protein kinase RdoA (MazF antagonist)
MSFEPALVDAMFASYGVEGPWETLPATGLANHVFATREVVLRVATDHRDGVCDARTESVAAPVARAAGIRTPRLLAFDDTRALVDRPFSLWERVRGETLGLANLSESATARAWHSVGRELGRLHLSVRACPDPNGWNARRGHLEAGRPPGGETPLVRRRTYRASLRPWRRERNERHVHHGR